MSRCAGHSARIRKEEFHRSGRKKFLQESFELIKRAHALGRRWSRNFDHLLVMSEMYYEDFRRTGSCRPLDHAIEFGVRASEISLDSKENWCKANLVSHLGSLFLRRSYQTRLYSDTSQGIGYIQLPLK
jgi:hypothetical protein